MEIKEVKDLREIQELYEISFPENERMELEKLERRKGHECLGLYQNDQCIGFIILLTFEKITHILYFAIMKGLQNQGLGSYLLTEVKKRYSHQMIIADLEDENEKAGNAKQRKQRIAFYLKNGFQKTNVRYHWEDEYYTIYSCNGIINTKEFWRFWEQY